MAGRARGGCHPAVQLTVHHIVLEALTNVHKHARANSVCVRVAGCGDRIEVSIADNGSGFPREPEPDNGIIGMRERVATHGDVLYMGSGERHDFLVRARIPMEAGT